MNFKRAFAVPVVFLLCLTAYGQKLNLLIGTSAGPGTGEGIYIYSFDTATGALTFRSKTVADNPSYLAIARDGKHVYAVNQVPRIMGAVSSFSYDAANGTLTFLNKTTSGGEGPAYVSVDPAGKFVFAANYTAGNMSAIAVNADGTLSQDVQTLAFTGTGPDPKRQTKPYLHCAAVSPDGRYLFANDLGTDKTYSYKIDFTKPAAPLIPADPAFYAAQPGSGPRHITFHPNQKFAYVVYEMGGIVNTFAYKDGGLKLLQTVKIVPEGFTGTFTSADIHVSPDGKFLYASNRLDINEIVIFSVDQQSGKLTYAGRESSMGKTPRNFTIDPTGNFLLVANQDSSDIFVFRRNTQTGLLTQVGDKLSIAKPTCLKFGF